MKIDIENLTFNLDKLDTHKRRQGSWDTSQFER